MYSHPFTAIPNILRCRRVACLWEILCLVREELARENVNNVRGLNEGETLQGAKVDRRNGQDVFRIHPIRAIERFPRKRSLLLRRLFGVQLWTAEAVKTAISETRDEIIYLTMQAKGNVPCSYNVFAIKRLDVRRCGRGVGLAFVRKRLRWIPHKFQQPI